MEVKFEDINEQDIVTLIAWFVKKKGRDIEIKTDDGFTINITRRKQRKKVHRFNP